MIASLSIPWGASKGDDDLGGYHLVWPRDLVESAFGLLAIGATEEVQRILVYLRVTQEEDGHWPQNMWLDGESYWGGIQLDETALPVILIDSAFREGLIAPANWRLLADGAARRALHPAQRTDDGPGPLGGGFGLLAVHARSRNGGPGGRGRHCDSARPSRGRQSTCSKPRTCGTLRSSAGATRPGPNWRSAAGVEGYYVRISPETSGVCSPLNGTIAIKNREGGDKWVSAAEVVSPDALALVRFGLRSADDPRIRNTVAAIDHLLKVDLPQGPLWRRYNEDGYGEKADGRPFDGSGIGRAWPLLAAERAHYELARGDRDAALRLLDTLEASTSRGGLIPEQVWDTDDIPALSSSGASLPAPPCRWSGPMPSMSSCCDHCRDGRVFDMPAQVAARYAQGSGAGTSDLAIWRFTTAPTVLPAGQAPAHRDARAGAHPLERRQLDHRAGPQFARNELRSPRDRPAEWRSAGRQRNRLHLLLA